jgi:transposase
MYETGAMRRTHLRDHGNIIKRLLIHGCAFNLGLVMRKMTGYGTPRGLRESLNMLNLLVSTLRTLWTALCSLGPLKMRPESRHFA